MSQHHGSNEQGRKDTDSELADRVWGPLYSRLVDSCKAADGLSLRILFYKLGVTIPTSQGRFQGEAR